MTHETKRTKLELEKVIFIGRTYEEYIDMFVLSEADLKDKKILDCPSGACSFTATGHTKGLNITAADIVYDFSADDLYAKGQEDLQHAMTHMEKAKDNYRWQYFTDISHLHEHREKALLTCTQDMQENPDRYIPVELPVLPFDDQAFDILVSAHFLFTYADRLDFQFHLDTLNELLRVTKEEIRLFPLIDLEGKRYEHLDRLIDYLQNKGYQVTEMKVPYEFQKGANAILRIVK
ncbi:SAM-dependent methyltransferase [Jeotgalibacillus sp. R-1-5s-1]|uniref:SAM-dependent methyltransferase n=1 Tax=Jeotgalibacillus sp. R-1-5s-1 TaxID=2555897 RepID=UPI001069408E|nr:SAM-dependent methyltransferase [Jeotgalibacillus sp. R-1-5s-1]TFD94342.1 SAM-dependent methyltransferase [Jeotgalibacillus sp. R-1-5s-1]